MIYKRLTKEGYKMQEDKTFTDLRKYACRGRISSCNFAVNYNRLAEYEDTGLSPKEIEALQAENARLTEQLENAVVLPCKVGTICLHIWCKEILPFKLFGVVLKNTSIGFAKELCLFGQMFYNHKWIDYDISINEFNSKLGETWFLTKSEAEARLKELEAQDDRD